MNLKNSEEFSNYFIADKFLIKGLTDQLNLFKRLVIHGKNIYRIPISVYQFFTFNSQRIPIIRIKVSKKYTFLNPVKSIVFTAVTDFLTGSVFRNVIYYPDKQTNPSTLILTEFNSYFYPILHY